MKKILLFAMLFLLAACNSNEPNKAFIGKWEPVRYEEYDVFVITSDSIKAINCDTKEEHYQCHYKILHDSIAELERCWLEKLAEGRDTTIQKDYHPELYFVEEVEMYIDDQGYLIIRPFTPDSPIDNGCPNYAWLTLKKK